MCSYLSRCALILWCVSLLLPSPHNVAAQPVWSDEVVKDSVVLAKELKKQGFVPPPDFKALVVVLSPDRHKGYTTTVYDYKGTSTDATNWWPASSIKLYAAIAALEKAASMGFSPTAQLIYHYDDGPKKYSLEHLVKQALIPSDNWSYDRLVEFVGFEELNHGFLTPAKGFSGTVLQRAYGARLRMGEKQRGTLRHSPKIEVMEGRFHKELPERSGKSTFDDCQDEGNCTPLVDLAEAIRRVVLHDKLPEQQRFSLGPGHLKLLRSALSSKRPRGNGVVDGLRKGLGKLTTTLYHKPGFALQWFSDVVFVAPRGQKTKYIVAMAGYPGRDALNDAAWHVGRLITKKVLKPLVLNRSETPVDPLRGSAEIRK
ncbi:MAG: serine hydrolase [Myxococcales bacterium]|nr:serine hydrolase [Myxococcales bacterium]